MRVGRFIVAAAIAAMSSAFVGSAVQASQPWPRPSQQDAGAGQNGGTGGGGWVATTSPTARPTLTVVPSGGAETGGGGSKGVALAGVGALALAGGAGVFLLLNRRRNELA